MKVQHAIDLLSRYHNPDDVICCVWFDRDDIKSAADDVGIALSDGQIAQVMNALENSHDANIGISWNEVHDMIRKIHEL